MKSLKKNVDAFNADVRENSGYRYTSNASFSSVAANERLTAVTVENIPAGCRTLIDIGCGDGTYTGEIKKRRPGLRVTGTDPARAAIARAGKLYKNASFFYSNILDKKTFKGKVKKCGIGVIRGVLHHLHDPEAAVRNSLTLAGRLIILEPNGNNPVLKLIEKFSKYHVLHEERSFTEKQLRLFCEAAGARVESVGYIGFVPFFCPEALARLILFFQPFLEKLPLVNRFLSAQIVLVCSEKKGKK